MSPTELKRSFTKKTNAPTVSNNITTASQKGINNTVVEKSKIVVVLKVLLPIGVILVAAFIAYQVRTKGALPEIRHAVHSKDWSTRTDMILRIFGTWSRSRSYDSS